MFRLMPMPENYARTPTLNGALEFVGPNSTGTVSNGINVLQKNKGNNKKLTSHIFRYNLSKLVG